MKSKTIILSSENNQSGRGILTIYSEDDLLKCRLRLYNVQKLNRNFKLGIYHNNEVFSANLLEKNGTYESSLVGNFNIDEDFYTAIVDTGLNNKVLISGGTYSGHFFNEDAVFTEYSSNTQEEAQTIQTNEVFKDIEHTQPKGNIIKPIASNEELEQCKNDCLKCENCVYKEYFYSNQENQADLNTNSEIKTTKLNEISEAVESLPNNKQETPIETSFLASLKPQFEYVFNNYPKDDELVSLIENSNFAKINEGNKEYSIGVIYQNKEIKYICYAVKSLYNAPPPEEIGDHYQWLPLDKEDPLTDGYYLVFQDSKDLKILDL